MAAGLFMITVPSEQVFKLGLATVIAGNGLFKPNISTMVGALYDQGDARRADDTDAAESALAIDELVETAVRAAEDERHRRYQ